MTDVFISPSSQWANQFAGGSAGEQKIKEETGATARCIPLEDSSTGKCIITGVEGAPKVIFAKAY